ncbi:MAG TPA: condensation domain-containing protein, partial [Vicinamibacteria bacterium]
MVHNNRKLSSREKRLLLKQLLREEAYETKLAPLSYAQERLWFLSQLEVESSFYTETGAARVSSEIDVALLAEALNEISRRHEVLRTTFGAEDGRPFQRISATGSVRLALVDLQAVCESRHTKEVERLVREQSSRPFDLGQGPLIRTVLLRLSPGENAIVISLHHIISDGWSLGVLLRELVTIYSAFRDGKESPLPALGIQYADYARWERELLSQDYLADQLSYWRRQLSNLPVLNLPTDRPRPSIQSRRGATLDFELGPRLHQSLTELSRSEKGTLFMTLMAALKVLLSRYSGQDDIVVGSAIAGRDRPDLEPLIGFFVNMLVMRTSLSGDPTFRELTRRAREVALSAYAHQRVPFEKLVEELQPDRDLSREPLFQVAMSVDRYRMEIPSTAGFPCAPLPVDSGTAKFDMTWFFLDGGKKLVGSIQYSLDLFDRSTILRALNHLETLLESVVANPDRHLSEIALLTPGERQQLLVEWPAVESDYPRRIGIADLFEMQTRARPEAVAVAYGEEQLSYAELNRR